MYWILIGTALGITGVAAGWLLQRRPEDSDDSDQMNRTFSWVNRLIASLLDKSCDQDAIDRMFLESILNLADTQAVLMLEAADTSSIIYRSPSGLPARANVVQAMIAIPGGIESPENWKHVLLEWNWEEEQSSEEQHPCWIPEYRIISADMLPPQPLECHGFWLIPCLLDSGRQGWLAFCGNHDQIDHRIDLLEEFVRYNLDSRSDVRETIGLQQLMSQTFNESKHAQVLIKDDITHYFNSSFLGLTGYSHDELLGQSFQKIILHEDILELQQYILEQQNDAFPSDHLEIRMVHQGGLQFHVKLTPTKVSYKGSDALVMTIEDVSPRINLEQSLMDKCLQQELIINELMETKSKCTQKVDSRQEEIENIQEQQVSEPEQIGDKEADYKSVDGLKQQLASATAELKAKNEELKRMGGELKNLHEIRDKFVSGITGGLLASLMPIKGSVSMVMDGKAGEVTPNIKRFLMVCLRNVNQLITMTNNLIDISKIESGRIEFNPTECDVKSVVSDSIKELEGYSSDSIVELNVEVPDQLKVWADRDRIGQVLQNLLSNALKFTEVGEVAVRASKMNGAVQIEVEDTGMGIPPEKLDTIFDKFAPLDKPNSRGIKGSGLGLAVCNSIVKKHHGTIAVKSQLGAGSCFSVMLPDHVIDSLEPQPEHNGTSELHSAGDGVYQMLDHDRREGNSD